MAKILENNVYEYLQLLVEANNPSGDMWIGLLNPDGENCSGGGCAGKMEWIDGSVATAGTISYIVSTVYSLFELKTVNYHIHMFLKQDIYANERAECLRMTSSSGDVGDISCGSQYQFLCQYTCKSSCDWFALNKHQKE